MDKKLSLKGLRECLRTFDDNGRHARRGDWSIGNGGYDLDFEIYYKDDILFSSVDKQLYIDVELDEYSNINKAVDIIVEELRGIKRPTYHLGIIDHNVEIPKEIDKEYTDINEAYEALSEFVHSFDGIMQVDGRVMNNAGDDEDYSSSIMDK